MFSPPYCYSVPINRKAVKYMTLTVITEGLLKLLEANHYNPATIRFYQREWNKISSFLYAEYSDEEFEMERGLAYLENQYGFVTRYNDGTLSQQRVQLLRVVHMLEDYRLHQVLTRRYHASKNPIVLGGKIHGTWYQGRGNGQVYSPLNGRSESCLEHSENCIT